MVKPSKASPLTGYLTTKTLLSLNALLLLVLIFKHSASNNGALEGSLLVTPADTSSGGATGGTSAVRGLTNEGTGSSSTTTSNVATVAPLPVVSSTSTATATATATATTPVRSFLEIAKTTHTDKVEGNVNLKKCLEEGKPCLGVKFERDECKPWGHFYNTLYQRWLEPYSRDDTPPFLFLEVGFYSGNGFMAYEKFMPKAQAHSIEISCVNDGQGWSLGNTAKSEHPQLYNQLIQEERLHCGSAVDYTFLDSVWNSMKSRNLPLRVVVDDASHLAQHMVTSVFYWFPKIEPGGLLIVEDIQPTPLSNTFRTQFLPQIMSDLHWCGHPQHPEQVFFPTLQPLLHSVSCEMHICVLERNQKPPNLDLTEAELQVPAHALDWALGKKTKHSEKALP